jgi:O-antigen biosynthesis protein
MSLPATSLLVCSRNRPGLLFDCVASILKGRALPDEIVVVDQSSEPLATAAAWQPPPHCEIRYLWRPGRGVSLARNTAMAAARHELLVFTDDDVLVSPDWLQCLVGALLQAGADTVVTGRVLPTGPETAAGSVPSTRQDEHPVTYSGRIARDVLFTNNMAARRSTLEAAGAFDERLGPGAPFPAAEDNDFAFRLLEAGCRIAYAPQAVLYHRDWRTSRELLWLQWSYGRGQGAFYAKYFSLKDAYTFKRMAHDLWAYLARFPLRLLRRRGQAYQDVFFAAGLLVGAAHWRVTHGARRGQL